MAKTLKQLIESRGRLRSGGFPPTGSFAIVKRAEDLPGRYWAIEARFNPTPKKGRSVSGKKRQSHYKTYIVFTDMKFTRERTPQTPLKIEVLKGEYRYMTLPSKSKTKVRVACTCDDFYWTWVFYNEENGSYSGDPPVHPSKITGHKVRVRDGQPYGTVPGGRNDAQVPGICKHINALAQELVRLKRLTR